MKLAEALIASGNCSTQAEAIKEIKEAANELHELIAQDETGTEELGDYCMERWGLEPDYLEELLF